MGPGCCSTVPMRILAVLAKNFRPPLITLTFPMPPGVMGATRQKKAPQVRGAAGPPDKKCTCAAQSARGRWRVNQDIRSQRTRWTTTQSNRGVINSATCFSPALSYSCWSVFARR